MARQQASSAVKAGMLLVMTGVLSSLASAQSYGSGSSTQWMNQYFLPANAQIAGVSGLVFGVLLPFGIVLVLLYTLIKELAIFEQRQAQALALLISLFIIPSGGYQLISEFLIGVFSLGAADLGGVGVEFVIPGVGTAGTHLLVAVVAFLASAWFINNIVTQPDKNLSMTEYLGAAVAAFMVWLALNGGVGVISVLLGWGIMLYLGWEVFKRGTGAGGLTGIGVGLVGLFVIFAALSSFDFLPQNIQNLAETMSAAIPLVVVVIVILTALFLAVFIVYGP